MKTKIKPIYLVPILAVVFVLIYATINSLVSKGSDTLHVYSSDEMGEQVPFLIEDFSLLDQNGKIFTRADIGNRIVISNFFFASCPEICPTINGNTLNTAVIDQCGNFSNFMDGLNFLCNFDENRSPSHSDNDAQIQLIDWLIIFKIEEVLDFNLVKRY